MLLKVFLINALVSFAVGAKLKELFAWKELTFTWPNQKTKTNAIKSGEYIPENNLPLGLDRWKNKLFITVPRMKSGVAATLNYVLLPALNKTAELIPYPNWEANTLPICDDKPLENSIISTYRVRVDPCDRLWVMDTGLAYILGKPKQISTPAILVFNLYTDMLIRKYEFKPEDLKEESYFANIIVDVTAHTCDKAYAYVPDLGGYGIVVYSWEENTSWRIQHNYFYCDPLKGDFNIGGVNFQWTDGVFGLALSKINMNGFRTMYFHALASTKEFSVSTEVLQNRTLAKDPKSYHLYKVEGEKGFMTQSSASDLDKKSGILFLTQIHTDGVACWNPKMPLNSRNFGIVAKDKKKLIYTNDLRVDSEQNIFILSDKMPVFMYGKLDPRKINYRIFTVKVADAIVNTPCANY